VSEIVLFVAHMNSGGRIASHVDAGEIIRVVVDGKAREPKSKDFGAACTWLQANGYKPAGFQWIDKAGMTHRRRKCTYVKEA
jgi:hypothetical protein